MTQQILVSYNGLVKAFYITPRHLSFSIQKKLQEFGFERRFVGRKLRTDNFSKVEAMYNTLKPLDIQFHFFLLLPDKWGKEVTWEEFKEYVTKAV